MILNIATVVTRDRHSGCFVMETSWGLVMMIRQFAPPLFRIHDMALLSMMLEKGKGLLLEKNTSTLPEKPREMRRIRIFPSSTVRQDP